MWHFHVLNKYLPDDEEKIILPCSCIWNGLWFVFKQIISPYFASPVAAVSLYLASHFAFFLSPQGTWPVHSFTLPLCTCFINLLMFPHLKYLFSLFITLVLLILDLKWDLFPEDFSSPPSELKGFLFPGLCDNYLPL